MHRFRPRAPNGPRPCARIEDAAFRGVVLVMIVFAAIALLVRPGLAQTVDAPSEAAVYVVPITGTIDLGLAPYLSRVLAEAEAEGAAAVVLDIDTPGGRLDAVLQMRDALLGSPVRTIAFVDRTAFSAGALIAIAAAEIYMAPGAVMGAATPVDGVTGETASEKIVSAVRTTFKATAEARGRDPLVAEAMVDPDVTIDGLVSRGELLTLTTSEATTWGYNDGIANTLSEVLAAAGLENAPIVESAPSLAERVVRFVTDPAVSTLLISGAVLLIIADFFVEGFGIAGVAGFGLLGLFFWGHFLAGLAGWEDLALVVLGLLLIAVEIIIVPGFGIPGVLGLAALLGGLFLAMLGRDIQTPAGIEQAAMTVLASLVAIVVGTIAVFTLLARGRRPNRLVLQSAVGGAETPSQRASGGWLGWFGAPSYLPREGQGDSGAQKPVAIGNRSELSREERPPGATRRDET